MPSWIDAVRWSFGPAARAEPEPTSPAEPMPQPTEPGSSDPATNAAKLGTDGVTPLPSAMGNQFSSALSSLKNLSNTPKDPPEPPSLQPLNTSVDPAMGGRTSKPDDVSSSPQSSDDEDEPMPSLEPEAAGDAHMTDVREAEPKKSEDEVKTSSESSAEATATANEDAGARDEDPEAFAILKPILHPLHQLKALSQRKMPPNSDRVRVNTLRTLMKIRILPVGSHIVSKTRDLENRWDLEMRCCRLIAEHYWPLFGQRNAHLRIHEMYRNALYEKKRKEAKTKSSQTVPDPRPRVEGGSMRRYMEMRYSRDAGEVQTSPAPKADSMQPTASDRTEERCQHGSSEGVVGDVMVLDSHSVAYQDGNGANPFSLDTMNAFVGHRAQTTSDSTDSSRSGRRRSLHSPDDLPQVYEQRQGSPKRRRLSVEELSSNVTEHIVEPTSASVAFENLIIDNLDDEDLMPALEPASPSLIDIMLSPVSSDSAGPETPPSEQSPSPPTAWCAVRRRNSECVDDEDEDDEMLLFDHSHSDTANALCASLETCCPDHEEPELEHVPWLDDMQYDNEEEDEVWESYDPRLWDTAGTDQLKDGDNGYTDCDGHGYRKRDTRC